MVKYCPICDENLVYDPATHQWYCIECECVITSNTGVDKTPITCYTRKRPRARRTPVRLRTAVLRD